MTAPAGGNPALDRLIGPSHPALPDLNAARKLSKFFKPRYVGSRVRDELFQFLLVDQPVETSNILHKHGCSPRNILKINAKEVEALFYADLYSLLVVYV